jgi:hypothetical protein
MTTTQTPRFRYLGTTDVTHVCEKCGKDELRKVVMIVPLDAEGNDDGEPAYYGSTCAARALGVKGGGRAVSKAAEYARLKTLMEAHSGRATLRKYGIAETGGLPADDFGFLMAFAKNNPGAARAALGISDLRSMARPVVENAQRWIAEAVLVAGPEWGKDPQPLEYYGRSAIKDTME